MNLELGPYARLRGKPVRAHKVQAEFHRSRARNKYFRGGVGSGKSLAGAWELLRNVLSNDEYLCETGQGSGAIYLCAAPRDSLVKAGAWHHLRNLLKESSEASGFNLVEKELITSPRQLKLVTGDMISFHTLKDPSIFAGWNAAGCWYDECELADNPDEGWTAMTARLRDERFPPERLRMILTSTPRGWRGMSAFFEDRQAANDPDYAYFVARNSDNPAMTEDFRARQAARMSERERKQQLDGALEAERGAVYGLEFHLAESVDPTWEWRGPRADRTYQVAIDWGGSYHALFIEHSDFIPGTTRVDPLGGFDTVFHEVIMDDVQVEEFLTNVKANLDHLRLPMHTVDCYCDYNPRFAVDVARSKPFFNGRVTARRVEGSTGDKERGIATVRWRLLAADGIRRLRFAPRIRNTDSDRKVFRCMQNYKRVENTIDGVAVKLGVNQDSPWSHGPDALRAYCWPRYGYKRTLEQDERRAA